MDNLRSIVDNFAAALTPTKASVDTEPNRAAKVYSVCVYAHLIQFTEEMREALADLEWGEKSVNTPLRCLTRVIFYPC